MDVSVRDGGCQIEYEHQDKRIHRIYLEELAKYGVQSKMAKFIDEAPYLGAAASAAHANA
jgi:5-enolpyruvylshikimate-3-phosphate synthase